MFVLNGFEPVPPIGSICDATDQDPNHRSTAKHSKTRLTEMLTQITATCIFLIRDGNGYRCCSNKEAKYEYQVSRLHDDCGQVHKGNLDLQESLSDWILD